MRKYFLFLLAVAATAITSQAQYVVKGVVIDSTGVSEPYATVRIYTQDNKEKTVKVGVTDIDGRFKQELKQGGKYQLQIKSVGKLPIEKDFELTAESKTKDFGTLLIKNDANTLAGVEVVAQKPLVTTEIDRLSYDVQADEESKTSTIFDMLKKVPMVTVDGEENIKVNGSSSFKIYKNGRPNTSWSNNPKDVLKSIPANMIKKIEVITEPGAKYDAEGVSGILNIITEDNIAINGVVGAVGANARSDKQMGAYTYMTTQIGKLTTSINYNFSTLTSSNISSNYAADYTYKTTGNRYISTSESDGDGSFHYVDLESSYEIDTLNLLTLSFGGYYFGVSTDGIAKSALYTPSGDMVYSYKNKDLTPKNRYFDFNGKLDYQHLTKNKGEALTLSYLLSTTNRAYRVENYYEDLYNFPVDYEWQTIDNALNFYEHTFQFDWTRPFAEKHKLETGLKYILRQNFSETNNSYGDNVKDRIEFDHTTHVGAFYSEYSYNGKKWSARSGLRYELARLEGEYKSDDQPSFHSTISDLVPTLSASYKLNDANTIKLNFATRINRPGISYLNPAKTISPISVSQGNPDLGSTRRNSLRLSYSLIKPKLTINTSANYGWVNNMLSTYEYMIDDIHYSTYANNGKVREFSGTLYFQWTASKSTSFILNGSLRYKKYSNSQGFENDGWGHNIYANYSQDLPCKFKLSVYGLFYKGGVYSVYSAGSSSSYYGFGLSRSFLKDDKLSVRLSAERPFSSKYYQGCTHMVNGDRIGTSSYRVLQRNFSINVSYRFGSLNASVKKVNKSISNDDLEGRK